MNFRRATLWLGGTQGVQILLQLGIRILLARTLGPVAFGVFGTALSTTTLLSRLLSVGIASSTQYFASRPGADRGAVLGTSLILGTGVGVFTLSVSAALLGFLQSFWFVGHSGVGSALGQMIWVLPLVVLGMNFGVMLIPWGRVRAYGLLPVGGALAFVGVFLLLVPHVEPLQAAIAAQGMVWGILLALAAWGLRSEWRELKFCPNLALQMARYGAKAWPNVCLSIGMASMVPVLGSRVMTPEELALLVLALNLVEGLFAPHGTTGQLILSRTAAKPQDAPESASLLMRWTSVYALVVGLGVAMLGHLAIPLIFGAAFARATEITLALLVVGWAHAQVRTMSNVWAGLGQPGRAMGALSAEIVMFGGAIAWLSINPVPSGLWAVTFAASLAAIVGWGVASGSWCRGERISPLQCLWPAGDDWGALRPKPQPQREEPSPVEESLPRAA